MSKEISALDLRKRFGEIIEEVRYKKEPYVVTRNGRAMIVLIDIEAYEASKSKFEDDAFVEEYSDERIAEFLKEDQLEPGVQEKLKRKIRS